MQAAGTRALMAMLEAIQPHGIALKRRVILESPRAHMFSQYLCGTETPDSADIIHEGMIRDRHGEMQRIQVLFDCGATSIFMAQRLLPKLGLPHEAAHTTTLGLNGQMMEHARDSRKATISAQYLDHLALVDEPEVLVVPIKAYDSVLGLPWFAARNLEIEWSQNGLVSLRTPCGSGSHSTDDTQLGQPERSGVSIETLSATAFGDLLASEEVAGAFAPRIEDCIGLLGATVERTHEKGEYPRMLGEWAGAAAVVAAEESPHGNLEWLLLARRNPKGETGWQGLAPLERTANDKASLITPPPFHSCKWSMDKHRQMESNRR